LNSLFFKNCVKGFIASIISAILLVFVFGYFCYTSKDPDSLINLVSMAVLYIGAFVGGFLSSRFNRGMGLLSGAVTGGIFMLFVVVLSLISSNNVGEGGFVRWIMFLLIVVISSVGGYIGIPKSKKRKKHKSRRK